MKKKTNHEVVVKELDGKMLEAKVALADKWMELRQIETVLANLQQQYIDAVVAFGKTKGIDWEDKNQAWHFDGSSMTFTKRTNDYASKN